MIIIKDNELQVIRKINVKKLKDSIFLLLLSTGLSLFMSLLSWRLGLILLIPNLIFLALALYLYKQSGKETKTVSFSKEYLKIYHKNKSDTITTKSISSFSFDPTSNMNEIFINYKDTQEKKKTKIIILIGAPNSEFVDIANRLLVNDFSLIDTLPKDENVKNPQIVEDIQSENNLIDRIIKGSETNAKFIGKIKALKKNGQNYSFINDGNLVFISEEMIPLYFNPFEVDANIDEFDFEKTYLIQFDRKKKMFKIIPSNTFIDDEKISMNKKVLEIKNDIWCDKDIIKKEIDIELSFRKRVKTVYRILLYSAVLLSLIASIWILLFKARFNDLTVYCLGVVAIFAISGIAYGILFFNQRSKLIQLYKKHSNSNEK